MKASEMTNDELANFLDTLSALSRDDDKLSEAAARLRKLDGLNAKLKVAEDALSDAVPHLCSRCTIWDGGPNCGHDINRVDCVGGKVRRALAAIRKEGGAK